MSQQNALFWALLVILSFPLLIIWTFLGWILTSSPRICAVVAIILVTYTTGMASLYIWDQYLFLQYLCFLILFIFCFVYRSTTRIFRLSFLSFLILIQLSLHFLLLTNHEFSYRILLASWVSLLSSCNIVIVLLNLWLPVSEVNFLRDEGRFLESRCDRKLVRMLIASLGTIEVTDESSNGNDAAIIQKSKPILVLLHGYGGCNAQWVDCLAKLQSRSFILF